MKGYKNFNSTTTGLTNIKANKIYTNELIIDGEIFDSAGVVSMNYLTTNYYDKTEIDNNIYTKTQSDNLFYSKTYINQNFYTNTYINTFYYDRNYIDMNIYTKTYINNNYPTFLFLSSNYITNSYLSQQLATYIQTLTVGNITSYTIGYGQSPVVLIGVNSNSTQNNLIWDFTFGIPQGEKGDKGDKGDTGSRGPKGEDGADGRDGRDGTDAFVDIASIVALVISTLNLAGTIAAVATLQTQVAAIQAQIGVIQAQLLTAQGQISTLENKTLYQTSLTPALSGNNATRFNSELRINSGISDEIILNPYGTNQFYNNTVFNENLTCEKLTQLNDVNISGNMASGIKFGSDTSTICDASINYSHNSSAITNNQGSLDIQAYNITLGSASNFSTINLNGLNVNITGFLTINGVPFYTDYFNPTTGFFNQI